MSLVREHYQAHPSKFDDLHRLLDREPGLRAKLPAIRQAMLSCCGAEKSKAGKVELVVADTQRWDALSEDVQAIHDKLAAIDHAVQEIDAVLAEMQEAGVEGILPTVRGIWQVEEARRTKPACQVGEYINAFGVRVDASGRQIKSVSDPQALKWAERAQTALQEAVKIVG
ncbi:MAG: hypothetical protein HPY61_01660 [Methanotrichaceae archaeon]|nr:hypothetical protein [Methanotrichaceae archaeon]